MTGEELIELIRKNVPPGCQVGVSAHYGTISPEIVIGYAQATKERRQGGLRYVSDKARTGLYVLCPPGRIQLFKGNQK